jgi:predicted protein tyrosine phosphatase
MIRASASRIRERHAVARRLPKSRFSGADVGNAKRIVVESVIGAHYFACQTPWACISIVTEAGGWPAISEENRVGLLQLAFADITVIEGEEERAFREAQAHRILDFVKGLWDRIDVLMVHCEEGNSRGPAVAAAIARIYFGDDSLYFLPYRYWPNKYVYRVLLDTARKRGELRQADGADATTD